MPDYIPSNDIKFDMWQQNLLDIIKENKVVWELKTDRVATLESKQAVWNAAHSKATNKNDRTLADIMGKTTALKDYKNELRGFVSEYLAKSSLVSNSDRTRMGLTVKSTTRTASPLPTTHPLAIVDFSVRMQHTLCLSDSATPLRKAKPTGIIGCEVWVKIGGEPPKDATELSYTAICTSNYYLAKYSGNQAGLTVYYWLRWVNTRGERGPWSHTISSMIVV